MAEALAKSNPSLRLVRGFYLCPVWGEQQHWWCQDGDGKVVDPTAAQFPSAGAGEYVEFDGTCFCCQCGKEFREDEGYYTGNSYGICSYTCYGDLVGGY
jgi:hypothetical protein